MRYSEKKAAQVAAFFLFSAGGTLEILKLIKLMYLSERASFAEYGEPMMGDKLYSMEHGPVLSSTLDHINNLIDSTADGWESWISGRENHFVGLKREVKSPNETLTQLSDADLAIVESIWKNYGHMSASQLRNLTHKICTEWEDPEFSSIPIPYNRILKCVGYDAETASELEQRIYAQRRLETTLESADW
jgi:uncharacterized phage-associated protein